MQKVGFGEDLSILSLKSDKRCTAGIQHNIFQLCTNGLQATDQSRKPNHFLPFNFSKMEQRISSNGCIKQSLNTSASANK